MNAVADVSATGSTADAAIAQLFRLLASDEWAGWRIQRSVNVTVDAGYPDVIGCPTYWRATVSVTREVAS